jgi:dTDP-4-dehydrorhamnose 3,5-epimerase
VLQVVPTDLAGVLVLEPRVFGDERGYFFEAFNREAFRAATGLQVEFVQDNHSRSARGVVRGLHYQIEHPQGKLVWVTSGEVFDVAVDIRRSSVGFGTWTGAILSEDNHRQLWIPPGFAHGFCVLSENADVIYKATDFYHQPGERAIRWDDPQLAIDWPLGGSARLSPRDLEAPLMADAELFD